MENQLNHHENIVEEEDNETLHDDLDHLSEYDSSEDEDNSKIISSEDGDEEVQRRGCKHYARGCSFVSPCCQKIVPCRLCHDEEINDHTLDRHSVISIVCNKCTLTQPVSNKCTGCGEKFGNYFCSICRLYDDNDKQQFHCDGCGICRVGGRENFVHCDVCGFCLPKNQPHKCVVNTSRNDCPVCLEDLHSSRISCHILPCGHLLHTTCYKNLWKYNIYRCPTCNASISNLSSHWERLDQAIRDTPMPAEYANEKVWILCNDCHEVTNVLWHVFGLKCQACGSYNTCRDAEPNKAATSSSSSSTDTTSTSSASPPINQQEEPAASSSHHNSNPSDDEEWVSAQEESDESLD